MSHVIANVIRQWDECAKAENAKQMVHPHDSEDEFWSSGFRAAQQVRKLLRHPRCRVLDFGCGVGRVSRHLVDDCELKAYDSSASMLEKLGLQQGDWIRKIQLCRSLDEVGPVDIVFAYSVLIHYPYKAGCEVLRSMADLLPVDGTLAVQIPIYEFRREPIDWIDVCVWTKCDLMCAASANGLVIQQCWRHSGSFGFDQVGMHHDRLQVLRKIK